MQNMLHSPHRTCKMCTLNMHLCICEILPLVCDYTDSYFVCGSKSILKIVVYSIFMLLWVKFYSLKLCRHRILIFVMKVLSGALWENSNNMLALKFVKCNYLPALSVAPNISSASKAGVPWFYSTKRPWVQQLVTNLKILSSHFWGIFREMSWKGCFACLERGLRTNSWFRRTISISCCNNLVQIPHGNSERKEIKNCTSTSTVNFNDTVALKHNA